MTLLGERAPTRVRRSVLLTGSWLAGALALSTLPAIAISAAPKYADAICNPAVTCYTPAVAGDSDSYVASGEGGTTKATLAVSLNEGKTGPVCTGFRPGASDWAQVGFTNPVKGASWTKIVQITSAAALAEATAVTAQKNDLVCFEAPYRFFVRPGFQLTSRPQDKPPYSGVLPTCGTVNSFFPKAYRGAVRPLPCVSNKITTDNTGYFVQTSVRIPKDSTATRLRRAN